MLNKMSRLFPFFAQGRVVRGFGRGSKELGFPTANYPDTVVENLPNDFECGIYYGWANVDLGTTYKMVMSVGWNPFYQNTKKTMETHILHQFPEDFYGSLLKVCIVDYLRPEKNFQSIDDLKEAIQSDIQDAIERLEKPEDLSLRDHVFFQEKSSL